MKARDLLVRAILPWEAAGLPAPDLTGFWPRFDEVAPGHLRVAFRACAVTFGWVLPVAMFGRPLARLSRDETDAMLCRIEVVPGARDLLEVAKIVACLATFADARVQQHVRGHR